MVADDRRHPRGGCLHPGPVRGSRSVRSAGGGDRRQRRRILARPAAMCQGEDPCPRGPRGGSCPDSPGRPLRSQSRRTFSFSSRSCSTASARSSRSPGSPRKPTRRSPRRFACASRRASSSVRDRLEADERKRDRRGRRNPLRRSEKPRAQGPVTLSHDHVARQRDAQARPQGSSDSGSTARRPGCSPSKGRTSSRRPARRGSSPCTCSSPARTIDGAPRARLDAPASGARDRRLPPRRPAGGHPRDVPCAVAPRRPGERRHAPADRRRVRRKRGALRGVRRPALAEGAPSLGRRDLPRPARSTGTTARADASRSSAHGGDPLPTPTSPRR